MEEEKIRFKFQKQGCEFPARREDFGDSDLRSACLAIGQEQLLPFCVSGKELWDCHGRSTICLSASHDQIPPLLPIAAVEKILLLNPRQHVCVVERKLLYLEFWDRSEPPYCDLSSCDRRPHLPLRHPQVSAENLERAGGHKADITPSSHPPVTPSYRSTPITT
jgi:hypothetical protein